MINICFNDKEFFISYKKDGHGGFLGYMYSIMVMNRYARFFYIWRNLMFINLDGERINSEDIARYRKYNGEGFGVPGANSIMKLRSGDTLYLSYTVEQLDKILQECYVTVKTYDLCGKVEN